MTWRTLVALLLCAVCAEDASAQRFRRFGRRFAPPPSSVQPPSPYGSARTGLQLPTPYVPQFGGQFAPVQYFTPPVVRGADGRLYYPRVVDPRLNPYQSGYRQNGIVVRGQVPVQQLRPTPQTTTSQVAKVAAIREIEPEAVKIQQVAAGDPVASVRFQGEGDVYFRTGNHNRAFTAYKSAISSDSTRAEPYFRMAFLFASIGSHESSVKYLKQGLDLAPAYPKEGDRLSDMFGPNLADQRSRAVKTVVASANRNTRSPDHQLMAGAMLFFDGRESACAAYLERAATSSQRPARATALLSARENSSALVPPAPGQLKLAPEPETTPLPPPSLKLEPVSQEKELPNDPPSEEAGLPALPKLPPPPAGGNN